jgi:hypothetical protein
VVATKFGAPLATLAAVDWVDLLIIGLMLLAAVHGLRLGALVQLLTFGGFFVGFLIGTFVWIPLLSSGHNSVTRSIVVVSLIMVTACLLGYGGRVLGTWSNVSLRRHHLGHVDGALGVGVAILAVLLSAGSRRSMRPWPARTSSTRSTGSCPRPHRSSPIFRTS